MIFSVMSYFTGKHTLPLSVLAHVLQYVPNITIKIHIGIILMPSMTVDCAKRTPLYSHFSLNNVL